MLNRHHRRASAARSGVHWRQAQAERLLQEGAKRAESLALRLTPEQAREALARWAAQPGRTQAEVDSLNRQVGASVMGKPDVG